MFGSQKLRLPAQTTQGGFHAMSSGKRSPGGPSLAATPQCLQPASLGLSDDDDVLGGVGHDDNRSNFERRIISKSCSCFTIFYITPLEHNVNTYLVTDQRNTGHIGSHSYFFRMRGFGSARYSCVGKANRSMAFLQRCNHRNTSTLYSLKL